MQGHGTGSPAKEGLAGFQGWYKIERVKKLRHGRLVLSQTDPLTLPQLYDCITRSEQSHAFGESGLIQFLHVSVRHSIMLGSPVGIAAVTTMIETTMKLLDGASQGIVPIHKVGIDDRPDGLFAPVADVSDSVGTGSLLGK